MKTFCLCLIGLQGMMLRMQAIFVKEDFKDLLADCKQLSHQKMTGDIILDNFVFSRLVTFATTKNTAEASASLLPQMIYYFSPKDIHEPTFADKVKF